MGAALWLLDYLEDACDDPDEYLDLLPAPDLVCHPQSRIQEEFCSRRAAELLAGYGASVPYELCAAYLLLEREGDALANLNALTAVVMICALRHLPWAQDDFGARAGLFEEGVPDYRLQYEYCEEPADGPVEPGETAPGSGALEGQNQALARQVTQRVVV